MTVASTTPFALGAYLGDPDNSNPGNESTFDSTYGSFSTLMGATPQSLVAYVDQNQPISNWIGNAGWQASSFAQSPNARTATPVIGLPMASLADTSISRDQYFRNFASGQYDSVIQGVVKAWAQQGYSTQYWRPGWEMNLPGTPNYAGDDAQTQADWVKAFQHIYTVLHAAGHADGVNMQVVWNPGTINYSNAEATTNLYPGNACTDIIGADVYSDMYPYSLYNFDTGTTAPNLAAWMADPANRTHYWSNPAATQSSGDASGGHSLSLPQILQFAAQQGKPVAIAETGAGNSGGGTDVTDDAAFPQWLAQQLAAAQAAGTKVDFVDIWDSNGGGSYDFTNPADGKPQEAAAWAQYFGAQAPTAAAAPVTPPAVTLGSGSDTLTVLLSEDRYLGDAQFTLSVDGHSVAGTQTVVASHAAGQAQTFTVLGSFGAGTHSVAVDFLNDAYAGTPTTDRNLYVTGASYDGVAASGASLALMSAGTQSLAVGTPMPPPLTIGSGSDTLTVLLSEDRYLGDAQFTLSVDGHSVAGTQTVVASHAAGQAQTFTVLGSFGAGTHSVAVDFLNDAYAGTPATDRNLYVTGASYDGVAATGASLALMSAGTQSLSVGTPMPPPLTIGSGSDTLTVLLSEDRYLGDAQFTLSVDGHSVAGTQTVVASHAAGQAQTFTVLGSFGAGTHSVAVDFLNDAYAGTSTTDRNLYVTGASYDGVTASGASLSLFSAGTQSLTVGTPVTSHSLGSAGGSLTTTGNAVVTVGTGAVTVSAAGQAVSVNGGAGALTFIGGSGMDSVTAGSGAVLLTANADTLTFTAGSGAAAITAGSGHETFDLVAGRGGSLAITNFNAGLDAIHLQGYPSAAVLSTQTTGGSTSIVLSDDTRLTLVGVVVPAGQSVFS